MKEIKVGDRVAVFLLDGNDNETRTLGWVTRVVKNTLYVIADGSESEWPYHRYSCRLVNKRPRRRVWISTKALRRLTDPTFSFSTRMNDDDSAFGVTTGGGMRDDDVEFVEVRKTRRK